jgi:hypothetical protein
MECSFLFLVSSGLDSVLSSDGSIPKKLEVASLIITEGRLSKSLGAGGRWPFIYNTREIIRHVT